MGEWEMGPQWGAWVEWHGSMGKTLQSHAVTHAHIRLEEPASEVKNQYIHSAILHAFPSYNLQGPALRSTDHQYITLCKHVIKWFTSLVQCFLLRQTITSKGREGFLSGIFIYIYILGTLLSHSSLWYINRALHGRKSKLSGQDYKTENYT